jgi:hypothetical protein
VPDDHAAVQAADEAVQGVGRTDAESVGVGEVDLALDGRKVGQFGLDRVAGAGGGVEAERGM